MNTSSEHSPLTLILPGWQNSGAGHWQSLWEQQLGCERVQQHDWMRPLRGDWITRLEDHLLSKVEQTMYSICRAEAPNASIIADITPSAPSAPSAGSAGSVVLVAHSLGCHLVSAWAALSKNTHLIRGALLVAPPDGTRENFPPELKSWRPPVLQKLPFPSICVVSNNDPFCDLQPGREMASAWGSQCVELGNKGHINAKSGLLDWPQGQALLAQLMH